LTGRESPIIGTRATATSTLALIKEGTQRVEEVLENIRLGFSEILYNCFYLWIQYGLEDLDSVVFGNDESAQLVREFFTSIVTEENINGAIAVDLTVTDASTNRQAMQQMQLTLIQIMMQYLEKVLEAGNAALQMQQMGNVQGVQMVVEVMTAARNMFSDLLNKYDIRNPEDYLPSLEKYLGGVSQTAVAGGPAGPGVEHAGAFGGPALPPGLGAMQRIAGPSPTLPGAVTGPAGNGSIAGQVSGIPRPNQFS
jgi:hypothetical protein